MHRFWEALQCGAKERLAVCDVNWPMHCTCIGACCVFTVIRFSHEVNYLLQPEVCVQTSTYAMWILRGQGLCSETEREIIWLGRQELRVGLETRISAFPGRPLHSQENWKYSVFHDIKSWILWIQDNLISEVLELLGF